MQHRDIDKSIFQLRHIWLLLLFALACIFPAQATHLVGGSVTYKFIEVKNGMYVYEVKVAVYRDARTKSDPNDPNSGSTPFDPSINLGIYENRGGKGIYESKNIPLTSETTIDPFSGGSACPDKPNVEIREGLYITKIQLPASDFGYHMQYIRCCRNTLVNMPDNEGQTYYAFIPATSLKNTSPTFTDVPVPYLCANDTINLLNSATDADGDSLSFRLAHPYAGGDKFAPNPAPADNFTTIPKVNYYPDFSYLQPFGPDGYANVDPLTGSTKIYVPDEMAGRLVIAIDVLEYRNGKLISTTRRDIQLIVSANCKPNPAPFRSTSGGTLATTFYITAGETLTIPLKFNDDNDITIIPSGELVDPNGNIKPVGTFSVTKGNKTINTTFTWETKCHYARNSPYILNVTVRDDGCPPKVVSQTYSVYVRPYKGTDSIYGPSPACFGGNGETYSALKKNASSSLVWKAIGGEILNVNGSSAQIKWTKFTDGFVKVVEVSQYGCPGDTVTKRIKIRPVPKAGTISGTKTPCVEVVNTYNINPNPGSVYYWNVEGGTLINSGSNGKLDVLWSSDDTGRLFVFQKTIDGCYSDTTSIEVIIKRPIIDSVFGSLSVCPNSKSVDYWVVPREGSTISWEVIGGKQVAGGNEDHIKVDWFEKGTGYVKAVEITKEGCISDTIILPVTKDYVLITQPIKGDTAVCEYANGEKYNVLFTNGSTYSWKIIGGSIITGAGSAEVTVNWDNEGTGFLIVEETAWDPINNKPCKGKPVTLRISIYPIPQTKGIFGPGEICEEDTAIYYVSGRPGSTFTWTIDDDTLFSAKNGNDTFIVAALSSDFKGILAGKHILRVREMTKDSCYGEILTLPVIIHPMPKTTLIDGPLSVCQPNFSGHKYKVSGLPGSTFEWQINGGVITNGLGTDEVTVDWTRAGLGELIVLEKSSYGCVGKPKELLVRLDSLYIEIVRVTTGRSNEKVIELYWKAKNTQFFNGYVKVYRQRDGQGQFVLIDSIIQESGFFTDKNVATEKYTYKYYIEAINICGEKVKSLTHRTMLLKNSIINDTTGQINWTRYEGWPNGVDYYYVYRRLNDDTTLVFHELSKLDTFLKTYSGLDGYRQCYRVEARKAQDNDIVSWSNSVCFEYEPILWIPNAFTPDNYDNVNKTFKVFVSNYRQYEIKIYDRWGARIFESTDPKIQWDGTFRGKECPVDVYLYMITVKGLHTNIYKNGTIHLLK